MNLPAITLKWEIHENDRLELVKTAMVHFYINKTLQRAYEERNIIDLTCYETKDDNSSVKGSFAVYTREAEKSVFEFTEKFLSDFIIHPDGSFKVSKEYMMPNLRHIPTFPDRDIKIGDSWSAPAELIVTSFSIPISLQFTVDYTLESTKVVEGKNIAKIVYKYKIDKDLLEFNNLPADMPKRIVATNEGAFLWDIKKNQPLDMLDKYHIIFAFLQGKGQVATYEFLEMIDTRTQTYPAVTKDDKEKGKKDIEKALPKDSGVTVDTNDQGIVIHLGEILFDFDSYKLRNDTVNTLDQVIKIIKEKYPDRELIIDGHTDNVGKRQYNLDLSEKRAENVAKYMKEGVKHDKISYKGDGPDKPLNDNSTKEKRQANRRVDITIKLN